MTSKRVRVTVQSPQSSETDTAASRKSGCSRCSHCHERRAANGKHPTKGSVFPSVLPSTSRPPQTKFEALNSHHIPGPTHLIPHLPDVQHVLGQQMPIPVHIPHEPRLNSFTPAPVLHNLGRGPEPLFGWGSVMPLSHTYGQPRYIRRTKPDYRRLCFSVGKADVPFAAMPGGSLWGMDVTMAPQIVGGHRW